jgi:hypothetical protein
MATDRAGRRVKRPVVVGALSTAVVVLVAGLALHGGVARAAYVPPGYVTAEFSGAAGTKISGIGLLADASCTNVRNVVIRFGDGTSGPPDTSTVEGAGTRISGSHTYAAPGDYLGAVDLDATCTNNLGVASDQHATGNPGGYPLGFIVHVTGGNTCIGSGQTTPFAHISQSTSCSFIASPALDKAEKALFRQLAGLAYKGYVVDKAIDDAISKWTGETWVTENIVGQGDPGTLRGVFKDFVTGKFYGKLVLDKVLIDRLPTKLGGYAWMLDAPKYASWLDYLKYLALTRLADDPPDPNFTALASPPKVRALRGAPNEVGQRDRREAGLYIALLTTVERAAGAEAAGATAAQTQQRRHASDIAKQLVSLLAAQQKALKSAAREVKKIRAGHLPRAAVLRAKRGLRPSSLKPDLRKLGFTDEEIASGEKSAPALSVNSLTASFDNVLGLDAAAKTIGAERAMLTNFADRNAH